MSGHLTAPQIFHLAFSICDAAAPQTAAFDPGSSVAEQAQQATDWLQESHYEDEHLRIAVGGVRADGGRTIGWEVSIGLGHKAGSDATVFLGYQLFDDDQDPATDEVPIDVVIWQPGPWVAHLVTVARRALAILQGRMRNT